jgi:hypothetical protein
LENGGVTLGPFDIAPERVEALGVSFTPFVNKLLDLETRACGLQGHHLSINSKENTPDGGVDASLLGAPSTDYLPIGDSAWQFKRTNLGPKACADEFAGAEWAHHFVRAGGSYVLVLGAALPPNLIESRRKEVAKKAIELGLLPADDPQRIRVYDANKLARWASNFPSLAVSRLAGGPGSVAVDYEWWASGRTHDKQWVGDDDRNAAIQAIRSQVSSVGAVDVRVQGDSGIGKTRLVLEALNEDELRPLVAYVADERSIDSELLIHLVEAGRATILVVDECPAERHVKLVEKLSADPAIRLITIGDSGTAASRSPVIGVVAMPGAEREEFLRVNYPELSAEARRFVSDHSRGNMRWTIVLADRVSGLTDAQAADLITRDDIQTFVATILPEGRDFFCSTVLALFERVGWDRDMRSQLELLASFAGVPVEQMEDVGSQLQQQGLLVRQGRYRAVGPHPLAVLLAAEAWRLHGGRIVSDLLPQLDEEMALSLFRRVADLGRFEPATSVLPRLLSADGPFSSLEQIEIGGLGTILTQLAIVLPDDVMLHLGELIEAAPLEELRAQSRSRRDLVWTLEKLAWHRRTFTRAADSLLRLALAENETYANNATGTWVDLFGTILPGTAATPAERVEYLQRVLRDPRPEVRLLAISGAARSLAHHESITVSGELQGGVLVEPRGMPATYEEAGEYRRSMIALIALLLEDDDPTVRQSAEDTLIEAVHPVIDDRFARDFLALTLLQMKGASLQRLRTEVEHILSLYERRPAEERPAVVERLEALLRRLPAPSKMEELQVLVHLRRWDFPDGELKSRIEAAVAALESDADRQSALDLFKQDLPADWELGRAFAVVHGEAETTVDALISDFSINSTGLVGYLSGLVETGRESAFDDFLGSEKAQRLDLKSRLTVAVRGPVTDQVRARVLAGLRELPVADGTHVLFGWLSNLSDDDIDTILDDWLTRVSSQRDYSALVDWFNLWLHNKDAIPDRLRDRAFRLVMLRREYPDISRQRWDWCRIAGGLASEHGVELARLVLDLVDSGLLMIHEDREEAELLSRCAQKHPQAVWDDVARRLADGSWRLPMQMRGWFLNAVPVEVVQEWVGTDVERARLVASIATPGGEEPTPVARFLLDKFGEDRKVASGLWSSFVSGFWFGPESEYLSRQIEQLNGWRQRPDEPLGVRNWAREMIEGLEVRRAAALEREAERDF